MSAKPKVIAASIRAAVELGRRCPLPRGTECTWRGLPSGLGDRHPNHAGASNREHKFYAKAGR